MRVAVLGAAGRMGGHVCRAVAADERFELVGAVDPSAQDRPLREVVPGLDTDLTVSGGLAALTVARVEAVVDFTAASSAVKNLTWCANNKVHAVCGTTGIDSADLERLRAMFSAKGAPNCVIAPNFAISAVLLMRFCEIAAPFFGGAEIIELHHNEKRDAPSGTALETARRITAARGEYPFASDPTVDLKRDGARGGLEGDVHIHSVRLPGLLAHEEVIFGAGGQALTIRQDSFDYRSFMPGIVLALASVATSPGFNVGLDAILEF